MKIGKKHIQIYARDEGVRSTNVVKRQYKIGDKVNVYYKETETEIEQLNIEKKIFLGKYYAKLKTKVDNNKKAELYIVKPEDTITSQVYQDKIPNISITRIGTNDIYIEEDNYKEYKNSIITTIVLCALIVLPIFIFMLIVYFVFY